MPRETDVVSAYDAYNAFLKRDCGAGVSDKDRRDLIDGSHVSSAFIARLRRQGCMATPQKPKAAPKPKAEPKPKAAPKPKAEPKPKAAPKPRPSKVSFALMIKTTAANKDKLDARWSIQVAPETAIALKLPGAEKGKAYKLGVARDLARLSPQQRSSMGLPGSTGILLQYLASPEKAQTMLNIATASTPDIILKMVAAFAALPKLSLKAAEQAFEHTRAEVEMQNIEAYKRYRSAHSQSASSIVKKQPKRQRQPKTPTPDFMETDYWSDF